MKVKEMKKFLEKVDDEKEFVILGNKTVFQLDGVRDCLQDPVVFLDASEPKP